ncbi:MAG: ATP-binding cassette domain-containing protein, partial [Acidobacteriota bacterium]
QVLDRVSFQVARGETVIVLGRSGVGKSVMLKHIMGFLAPDSGRVFVDGQEITGKSEEEMLPVRRKVTMVFQSGALFDSLTVGENIALPLREKRTFGEEEIEERVSTLLEQVDLSDIAGLMPSDLSTGMKRAVAIARALAAEPEAILYDEPTTMVDPLMARTIGNLILKLKQQTHLTAIVVTHDMKLARKLADRVVFLVEGKVAYFGPMEGLNNLDHELIREFIQLDEVSLLESRRRPGR